MSYSNALPPLTLLNPAPPPLPHASDLAAAARRLAGALGWLNVPAVIVRAHHGPRVDSFEVQLAEKRTRRELDNLVPRLTSALDVESAVAELVDGGGARIQISHDAPEHVSLRALLESDELQNSRPTLSVALGRTAEDTAYAANLSAMPHLLIGGARDSGKRTFLNALLTTLLFRCTPTELRLLLVDPTGRALRQFVGIPHLLAPVLTEPFHAAYALRWAVREMEKRYKRLAAAGARSIEQYNNRSATAPKGLADFRQGKRLHHVVVVYTELAAALRYAKAEAEEFIFNLSWMSRAAGIHLLVATADLSPTVFPGIVNVSLPARISFKASSRCDSLTMVFGRGAEHLLPRGDAFFMPPASTRPVRVHTPFVSEEEVRRVTSHWRNLGMPRKP